VTIQESVDKVVVEPVTDVATVDIKEPEVSTTTTTVTTTTEIEVIEPTIVLEEETIQKTDVTTVEVV